MRLLSKLVLAALSGVALGNEAPDGVHLTHEVTKDGVTKWSLLVSTRTSFSIYAASARSDDFHKRFAELADSLIGRSLSQARLCPNGWKVTDHKSLGDLGHMLEGVCR